MAIQTVATTAGAATTRHERYDPMPDLVVPLGIYLATRVVQLLLVVWMSRGGTLEQHLFIWDGGWFVRVASQGYPHGFTYAADGTMVGNGLAFFPLYPLCIRAVHVVGLGWNASALVVSGVSGAVAAVLLHRLGTGLYRRRVGYALVVLFCAQPMSVVLSMGYSEALFSALVIGMLLAAYRERWLLAGVLGLGAGLTRPTGLAAAVALAVAAALAVRRDWAQPLASRIRPVLGAWVALLAVPAYLVWVGLRVGDPDAWFKIQTAGWGTTFDWGASVWSFVWQTLRGGTGFVPVAVVFILIGAVVAAAIAVVQRVWPPLTVYGLLVLALVLGQAGYFHSKPRLLVPVLLILVPAALAAARARTRTAVLGLTGYAVVGLWFGAYMITIWPFAI